MWRLRIAEDTGGDPWLRTTNGHAGRQVWVFEPTAGAVDDLDTGRDKFYRRRHQLKHSADLAMRLQVLLFSRCSDR
jgi:cycloartenol synthase